MSLWRWVAKKWKEDNILNVDDLKREWMQAHGFEEDEIMNDCFFCQYCETHSTEVKGYCNGCSTCPAVRVDREFFCMGTDYAFDKDPVAFYNKLRSLNRKRKSNDKKRNRKRTKI